MYTVIVPFNKGSVFLNKFFDQILSQTTPCEKIIFINDGDSAISKEKILKYSNKIQYIDNLTNKGINYSIKHALNYVDTEFVKIMSIDDIFTKSHVSNSLNLLLKNKDVMMSFTNPGHYILNQKEYIDYDFNLSNNDKFFEKNEFKKLYKLKTFKIFSNSVFFRTSILKKFSFCFNNIFSKYADQILNTLIALNYKTLYLKKVDSYWCIHDNQINKKFKINILGLLDFLKKNHNEFYNQLKDSSFFYDLDLIDLLKLLTFKSELININLIKKFIKFYFWKKLKNILPNNIIKFIISKFS